MAMTEIEALLSLGRAVRDRVRAGMVSKEFDAGAPDSAAAGDLQYRIDRHSEEGLAATVRECFAGMGPLRLLSEGLPQEGITITPGRGGRLLVIDPIDGTRGLMHDKRSAFFLAALATDGQAPRLAGVTHAAMVEIPTTRSHLSDLLWAAEGQTGALTEDLLHQTSVPLCPRPSQATDLRHGFATVVRFFSGAAETLGRIHDALMRELQPSDPMAQQDAFEDQYISSAGQIHSLVTGRDRFVADLRPLVRTAEGAALRCAHPYDVCILPIPKAAGVHITAPDGSDLDAPIDLTTRVAWIGYANSAIRSKVEPVLKRILRREGLLS